MRALAIRLVTQSPLAVRADHSTTGSEMIDYIPGSTVLGGLATLYRAYNSQVEDKDFTRLFLNDEVCYCDLYPANFETLHDISLPVHPLPRTAISCKRHAGFKVADDNKHEHHGVSDNLLAWALFALGEKTSGHRPVLKALQDQKTCQYKERKESKDACNESMDRFTGYYRQSAIDSGLYERASTENKKLQTRSGINRESGTVEDGVLYNRMVFEEDVEFWGNIFLSDDTLYAQLRDFLKTVGPRGMLHIGTGRTRGLGKVTFKIRDFSTEAQKQERFVQLQKRLDTFNARLDEQIKKYDVAVTKNDYFFPITLHAPLILTDKQLRYRGILDGEALNELLGPQEIADLELLYRSAGIKRFTGWQSLWGTPRTNEYGIETGSVFLFRCSSEPSESQLRALFELQEQGIGRRRGEGFGRIRIADEFHNGGDQR